MRGDLATMPVQEALIPTIKNSLSCLQDSISRASNLLGILEEQTVGSIPRSEGGGEKSEKELHYSPLKHINSLINQLNKDVNGIGDRVNSMTELVGGEVAKEFSQRYQSHSFTSMT